MAATPARHEWTYQFGACACALLLLFGLLTF